MKISRAEIIEKARLAFPEIGNDIAVNILSSRTAKMQTHLCPVDDLGNVLELTAEFMPNENTLNILNNNGRIFLYKKMEGWLD